MADNELKVRIGADAGQLSSELAAVVNALKGFERRITSSVEKSASSFNHLKQSISTVPAAFDAVAAGNAAMERITKSIDEAAAAALSAGNNIKSIGSKLPLQDINALKKAVQDLKSNVNGFKPIPNIVPASLPNTLRNTTTATKASSAAFLDINRVIQDLPYGFVGIQNNLTQLPGSFRALSLAAKESGQSMGKVLLSSLGGIGGVGLAISAVTTALTFASVGFDAWTRGFNKSGKAAKDAADKSAEFAESIKSVHDIISEGTGSVQGEISQVKALAAAIQDVSKPYAERLNALKQLQKINKSYFGDLTLEASKLSTVAGKVNEYTQALVANAVLKGFTDEISRVSVELGKQEHATDRARTKMQRLEKALANFDAKGFNAITVGGSFGGSTSVSTEFNKLQKAAAEARQEFEASNTALETTSTAWAVLQGQIAKAQDAVSKFKSVDAIDESKPDKKKIDALKERIEALENLKTAVGLLKTESQELIELKIKLVLRDGPKEGLNAGQIQRQVNELVRQSTIEAGATLNVPIQIVPQPAINIKAADFIPPDFAKQFSENLKTIAVDSGKAFSESLAATISQGVGDLFVGLGESISSAFSGGKNPIAAFAESLLSIIGGVLQALGKQIIFASKLVVALKKTLEGIGLGAASLVLGVALVAAGGLLKNVKIPALAAGGIVDKPTFALIGEAGPEAVVPLNKMNQFIGTEGQQHFFHGEIHGDVIKLIYDKANRSQSRRF